MKILHINSYYSSSRFYKNLYELQVQQGMDLDVYVPVSNKFKKTDFDFGFYTNIVRTNKEFDRLFFHVKHNKILRDVKSRYNFDEYSLTHAHSLFSNGYVSLKIKEEYGVPYIVAVRNTDVNIFLKKMLHLRHLGVEILKNASQIIFLSPVYREAVIQKYVPKKLRSEILQKSQTIPNGIDDFWFNNLAPPKMQPDPTNLNLIQVGDISKNKNVEITVEACKILINKSFNIKLDLVGKIKNERIFKKIAHYDFVDYLGYKTKEELLDIYRKNHIFVMPSRTETFGLVYAEAMSQGLPVIYTRGQGFDTQFEDGTVGYAVGSNDPKEIADKIVDVVTNYPAISEKCTNLASKFKWCIIAEKYLDVYDKIQIK